jgi:hypothetical protein
MKSYTITFNFKHIAYSLTFVIGMMVLLSFTSSTNEVKEQGISINEAKSLYQANANSPSPFGGNLKAVTISAEMLSALNSVESKVDNPDGYRCYFAKGENGEKMSVIVAVDDNGSDIVSFITAASADNFDGCPPLCDVASPITN